MKEINLGKTKTVLFDKYLTIALSNEWLSANGGRPLEFDAKLTLDGQLVLSANLEKLSDRTKEVNDNVMPDQS